MAVLAVCNLLSFWPDSGVLCECVVALRTLNWLLAGFCVTLGQPAHVKNSAVVCFVDDVKVRGMALVSLIKQDVVLLSVFDCLGHAIREFNA